MLDDKAAVPILRKMQNVLGQFLDAALAAFKDDQKAAHQKSTCAALTSKAPKQRRHASVAVGCRLGDRVKGVRVIHPRPRLGSHSRDWLGLRFGFHVDGAIDVISLGAGSGKANPCGNY